MLFPTLDFGIFFFAVFILSWLLRDQLDMRKAFLLAVSYFFYGYWDWRFLGLLFASSTINYTAGYLLERTERDRQRDRNWIVSIAVILNLLILGFFKYYEFFILSLADILTTVGLERDLPLMEVLLPIGISFFTFQGISYVIDVSRGDVKTVKSPLDLFLYISFFPQLVAGPIVRASHFLPQLDERPKLDRATLVFGFTLILLGLVKKVIVASYLATEIVDDAFAVPGTYSSLDLLAGAHAFVVQIYCDFSGYSDIAIGVAALLGYRFKKNFDRPLSASTLQELWQRWHISLTSWLRDYVYRPLKGKKRGQTHMYRNLTLTMMIAGLWHGAAWTFVIWGTLQGVILVLERIIKGNIREANRRIETHGGQLKSAGIYAPMAILGRLTPSTPLFGWFITLNLFAITSVFFRSPDMFTVSAYYQGLLQFTFTPQLLTPFVLLLLVSSVGIQFLPPDALTRSAQRVRDWSPVAIGALFGLGLLTIEMLGPQGIAPFIYFQF